MLNTRVLPVGLVVLAFYSLFVFNGLRTHHFNPATFVLPDANHVDPSKAPRELTLVPGMSGYDGQFYYRLALTPFTSQREAMGIALDKPPAYRHQRILYPLIVHIVSLGKPHIAIWAMIGVNLAALFGVALLGARLAQSCNLSPWWGLAMAGYPGFVISLSRDLAEIVAAFFVLGGLLALRNKKGLLAGIAFALAVLTRETTVLIPASVAAVEGWRWLTTRRTESSVSLAAWWLPLCTFVAVQLILTLVWGTVPISGGGAVNVLVPFGGFVTAIQSNLQQLSFVTKVWLFERLFALLFAVIVLWPEKHSPGGEYLAHERLAFVGYLLLASILEPIVWAEDRGFLRALTEFYLLGMLSLFTSRAQHRWIATVVWATILYMTFKVGGFWQY